MLKLIFLYEFFQNFFLRLNNACAVSIVELRQAAMDGWSCCIRGYHEYQAVWTAAIGETLFCVREPTNPSDRYAVGVVRSGTIVDHLPRKISRVCFFEKRGDNTLYSGWRKEILFRSSSRRARNPMHSTL